MSRARRRSRVPATFSARERRYGLFLPAEFGWQQNQMGEYTERLTAALPVPPHPNPKRRRRARKTS